MIGFESVSKRFEGVDAVVDLDLHVPRGEVFGLLGPNGAGKTTSIRLLVGLLRPTGGRVRVGGHDVQAEREASRRIMGYIPDRPYIYDHLSGVEYMEFMGGLWGLDPETSRERGLVYLERLRMADAATRMIEGYSHGMKQKLALAGAFLHEPELLVIDEPMVGLDPRSARELRTIFREQGAAGRTVLLSTHQLEVAEAVCDRIGLIHEGHLIALGSVEELQVRAVQPGSNLEEIFLKLTEEVPAGPAPVETAGDEAGDD